jgi:SAM-dependent methyltransferase
MTRPNPLSDMFRRVAARILPLIGFSGSKDYWERRYRLGGHSGAGSRGENARYKAEVLNGFIQRHGVGSIVEFGCGDGYQLGMLEVDRYLGIDVSPTVLEQCRATYAGDPRKRFLLDTEYQGETADLALSLDVIFHLVEDPVYDAYLERLFAAGERFVAVYSTSVDKRDTHTPHVRHRDVGRDIAQRFPQFERMTAEEAALPPPVSRDRGLEVVFHLYARRAA